MAYSSGTATSQEDLMTQFRTFLIANGWTSDNFDTTNNYMSLHQGSVYVHFYWDDTASIAIYQSTAYSTTTPNANTNDSGNIAPVTGTITNGMVMHTLNNGSFLGHHFFTDNTDEVYAYMALETGTAGVWRFMGFGELVKRGDWTGGEFSFGTHWNQSGGQINAYLGSTHSLVCDAHCLDSDRGGFLHIEGLPNMGASDKWGVWNQDAGGSGQDSGSNDRWPIIGGSRGGFWANAYQWFALSPLQGLVPLLPIPAFFWDKAQTPDHIMLLGTLPDFRQLNITHFDVEQEVTIGSDTWIIFPFNAKVFESNPSINQSGNHGYAIKKVT